MKEDKLTQLCDEYKDLIETVEELTYTEKETVFKLKAKIRLFDGSMLWIREVWVRGLMEAYSYYWLRSDETLIMGWDNAPHHKNIDTFPHHKHINCRVEISQEIDLRQVLNFLKNFLLD